MEGDPAEILEQSYRRALTHLEKTIVEDPLILGRIESVCRSSNRACVRLLMSCLLAKLHNPILDLRKPYTQIGGEDCFSGRHYDEQFITSFINRFDLPCNRTTAFLTPALRNRNATLTTAVNLEGRPAETYEQSLQLLEDLHLGKVDPEDALVEIIRCLINLKKEEASRIQTSIDEIRSIQDEVSLPLSSEAIVNLISQHLECRNSSRLPVLVVSAAYQAASENLGERVLPLSPHTAADQQTGSLGDLEITLLDDDNIITTYEMKARKITEDDIDAALRKLSYTHNQVDNYIFITTEIITDDIREYCYPLYEKTGGVEFVVLDCISFLRHFLHLFHRIRMKFLEEYQNLVLAEPRSAVSPALKEAFLALRKVAESP